ncbi:MAG TPA: DUF6527 family protein [Chloroflexota bacterium]|jgi:hypothetical protein
MPRLHALEPRFVDYVPDKLTEGVLYVSMTYATAAHLCCCGCGEEVVTTLSPTDWQLAFDGRTVSLKPSIGNWSLRCQSHYWIRRNRVEWSAQMSADQIAAGRATDRIRKEQFYHEDGKSPNASVARRPRWLAWLMRIGRR